MGYIVAGVELETDDEGYLLEARTDNETALAIAAVEGIELTDAHWEVIRYMRDEFQNEGHTPNFRKMLKDFEEIHPGADSKYLYDLFPLGPAKQSVKIAGLTKPFGKGGY